MKDESEVLDFYWRRHEQSAHGEIDPIPQQLVGALDLKF
jgi:hypothetical protein